MAKNDIDRIKQTAGPYSKEALEGRQKFLQLRLRQDPEIIKIFTQAADRVAAQIKKGGSSPLRQKQLATIEAQLRREAETIRKELTGKLETYIEKGVEAGSWQSRAVAVKLFEAAKSPKVTLAGLDRMFVRVNRQAVAAIWNRTQNGMMLSDRIWKTGQNARSAIQNIIQSAVASGQDAVTTAKALEQYVKKGARTLAQHYPAMMEHMRGRVPKNLSYEALRLARTETTAAFGQGQIRTAQVTPGVKGIKYCLSSAHRIVDICDELARNNEAGLGPGVYAVDDPPPYPAHPNTMSYLVTVYEKPEDFVKRLKEWEKNPDSDQSLEEWYNNIYEEQTPKDGPITGGLSEKKTSSKLTPDQKKLYVNVPDLPRAARVALAKTWDEAQKFGWENGREILYKIDSKTGSRLYVLSGTKNQVQFTQELMDKLRDAEPESIISVHNHPSSSSFSVDDLNVLSEYKSIKYLTVVGHDGTRYLMRVGKGLRPTYAQIAREQSALRLKYYDKYHQMVLNNELTPEQANKEFSNQINQELAQAFGWQYQRHLPGGN